MTRIFYIAFIVFAFFAFCSSDTMGAKDKSKKEKTEKSKVKKKEDAPLPGSPKKVKPISPEKARYSEKSLKEYLKNVTDAFKKSYKKPKELSHRNIKFYALEVNKWLKSSYLEIDTGTYAWWYKKLEKNLVSMYIPKMKMDYAIANRDTKTFLIAQKEYMLQIKKYRELFSKKVMKQAKIPPKKLAEIQKALDKKEEEKEKRKRRKKRRN